MQVRCFLYAKKTTLFAAPLNYGRAALKKNEHVWSQAEIPALFELLVFRAVSENEITVQKGAELLKQSYGFVDEHCFAAEE